MASAASRFEFLRQMLDDDVISVEVAMGVLNAPLDNHSLDALCYSTDPGVVRYRLDANANGFEYSLDGAVWHAVDQNAWGNDDEHWREPREYEPVKYIPECCVCTSRELFMNGCTCGHVERKSWDEKRRDIERKKRE